ncbi:hypothetical protein [Polaromonas sp.]|uniref:hypothetical protein n=1 Tax=Polaromonas sp. TaxID=1869339 RepID=UPI002FCC23A2
MSMKTHRLLHRSGRNQFGDPGEPALAPYQPSQESLARDEQMSARHVILNEQFVSTHRARWLGQFTSVAKKDVWQRLHPHGRPSLSTFYAQSRESASFEEFLLWWLLSKKSQALRIMDDTPQAISEQLAPFAECGRYFVRYGKSERTFATI